MTRRPSNIVEIWTADPVKVARAIVFARPAKAAARAAYYRANGKTEQAERLELGLVAAKRCRYCGRELSDPTSVALGVGPDCAIKQTKKEKTTT